MKLRWILVLLAMILIGWAFWPQPSVSIKSPKTSKTRNIPKPRRLSPSELASQPAKPPTNKTPESIDPQCLSFWNELASLDLNRFAKTASDDPSFHNLEDPLSLLEQVTRYADGDPCGGLNKKDHEGLAAQNREFQRYCQKANEMIQEGTAPKEERISALSNCLTEIFDYRLAVLDFLSEGTELEEISDLPTLVSKLIYSLHTEKSPKYTARVGERILSIDPDNFGVALFVAQRYLYDANLNPEKLNQHLKAATAWQERLSRMDESHEEYVELVLAIHKKAKDWDRLESYAEQLIEQGTHPGLALYYQAWIQYERGNRPNAIALLKRAKQFEQTKFRAESALEQIQNPSSRTEGGLNPFFDMASGMTTGGFSLDMNVLD